MKYDYCREKKTNIYTGKQEYVICNAELVSDKSITENTLLKKLSWQDFWKCLNLEQRQFAESIMARRQNTLNYNYKKKQELKASLRVKLEACVIL